MTVGKEYLIKVKAPQRRHWIDYVIFTVALLLLLSGKYIIGIIHLILSALGYAANRRTTIKISVAGIVYPSLPNKNFMWHDIENVVLKDGVLTIDLKNNKLYQLVVHDMEAATAIEKEFNIFVTGMIEEINTGTPIYN